MDRGETTEEGADLGVTKQELQSYYWLKKNIEKLEHKLLELEAEATRVTTRITQEPKGWSSNSDELGGIVAEIISVQDAINDKVKKSYRVMADIEQATVELPERETYLIRARYIDCKSWEQIAVDMNYCWQHVHKIHSRALKALA